VADEGISPEILAFITEYIDSVVQLEVLLLMQHAPAKPWTAAEVARELRIETSGAASQLTELCARKLLTCDEQSSPVYHYNPPTPEIATAIERLSEAYEERRVSVINLIYSKPVDKLKSFADAFRLRKDPDA
jgi:predicted ArsR family transcriptional regulator